MMPKTLIVLFLLFCFQLAQADVTASDELVPVETIQAPQIEGEEPTIINPYGITAALTVPQPLVAGVTMKLDPYSQWNLFLEGGWFQYKFGENKSRSIGVYTVAMGVRYHPFFNWLTLSGSLGFNRNIQLSVDISNLKMDGVSLANRADLVLHTTFLGLSVGGEWYLSERVAFGVDLGVQLALPFLHGGRVNIVQNSDQVDGSDLSVDDQEVMKRLSSLPIPQVALARFIFWL